MTTAKGIFPWLLAARPKTLSASFVPIYIATAASFSFLQSSGRGPIKIYLSVLALASALLIQIGTNLINDGLDFQKGADKEDRLGPKRMTQTGLLNAKSVISGGFLCFLCAAVLGIPLVLQGGMFVLLLGVLSILCGYLYTGGPYPLAYIGLGDLFVVLFFGLGAVVGVYFLQTKVLTLGACILGLQVGFLSTTLIAINNFRDLVTDRRANKMTLAARFGKNFARAEIVFLFLTAFLLNIYWISKGQLLTGILPFVTFPLSIYIIKNILTQEPSLKFNKYLGLAALNQTLFVLAMSIGFLHK